MVKALLLDDDPGVLRTLKRILERKGLEVLAFESPILALEKLMRENVDLILTDLKMPQMDGLKFLEQVRKMRPQIPAILITGFATPENESAAAKLGIFACLKKPFEVEEIDEVIEQALKSTKEI